MQQVIEFDADLLRRYDISGPRYTSYPTAVQFDATFGAPEYQEVARASNDDPVPTPLSLYLHIPFCTSPCFYCACTRIITRDPMKAQFYLVRLNREIDLQAKLFDRDRVVQQLHFGGGTPTFLTMTEMTDLMQRLDDRFNLRGDPAREVSIEIDPRTVDGEKIGQLASLGFNRLSFGVQDFDHRVQQAVNRIQSVEDTLAVIQASRRAGFQSINLDLIYGLPQQNLEGFGRTLDIVIAARPERLAVYSYAHMPRLFKAQRQIDESALPTAETRLALLQLAIEKLSAAGYVYIGMDHFALPDDELVIAQREGSLQRNFQGYSTRADCDMIGFGMSSIGKVGNNYSQNYKELARYYAALDSGLLPVARGVRLSTDDLLRRDIIQRLMCQTELDITAIEQKWNLDFRQYFSTAIPQLESLATDGLIAFSDKRISVLPAGRLLIRIVSMCFDAYRVPQSDGEPRYSKVI